MSFLCDQPKFIKDIVLRQPDKGGPLKVMPISQKLWAEQKLNHLLVSTKTVYVFSSFLMSSSQLNFSKVNQDDNKQELIDLGKKVFIVCVRSKYNLVVEKKCVLGSMVW